MNRNKIISQAAQEITKKLVDDGKIIEAGWQGLRITVIPQDASQVQLDEMRMAFFAGAQHLYGSIMNMFDPGTEETPTDLRRMEQIDKELSKFVEELKLRTAKAGGHG